MWDRGGVFGGLLWRLSASENGQNAAFLADCGRSEERRCALAIHEHRSIWSHAPVSKRYERPFWRRAVVAGFACLHSKRNASSPKLSYTRHRSSYSTPPTVMRLLFFAIPYKSARNDLASLLELS